jgi:hypothetical protein
MRLIPKDGITITRDLKTGILKLRYVDSTDVSMEHKDYLSNMFKQNTHVIDSIHIYKGSIQGHTYGYFIYENDDVNPIGSYTVIEFLDNPHGYGQNDFFSTRFLVSKYHHGHKMARYVSNDHIHFMFKSDIAKRLYAYLKHKENYEGKFFDKIDIVANPCLAITYPTDGPTIQTYISFPKMIDTTKGKFVIAQSDGDAYRAMDIAEYYIKAHHTLAAQNNFIEWLKEVDAAANLIKATHESTDDFSVHK